MVVGSVALRSGMVRPGLATRNVRSGRRTGARCCCPAERVSVNEYAPPRGLCTADVTATDQKPELITSPVVGWDYPQAWSPDGARITFLRYAPAFHGFGQLWTVKPDGSDPVLIGGGPDDPDQYGSAAWSPDGRSLAFPTTKRTTTDSSQKRPIKLWVADAAGDRRRLLFEGFVSFLGWSPDGRQIYVLMDNVLRSIGVADGTRGEPDPGFPFPHAMSWPTEAFSPDGMMRGSSVANSIVIAKADGRQGHVLAKGVSPQVRPPTQPSMTTFSWSPDSKRIVYVSDGDCPTLIGLYSIGVDGRGKRRLTNPCRMDGTARADILVGSDATNGIYGLGGDDRVRAGQGHDYVHGGRGDDRIDGGPGGDRLYGGLGRDTLIGGDDSDGIVSRDGQPDLVRCGNGFDLVWADFKDSVARDCEFLERRSS